MKRFLQTNYDLEECSQCSLSLTHLYILDWLLTFIKTQKMFFVIHKNPLTNQNTKYYWVSYQKLLDDYTSSNGNCILGFKNRRSAANYLDELVELGFLYKTIQKNYTDKNNNTVCGTFTFYGVNINKVNSIIAGAKGLKTKNIDTVVDDKENLKECPTTRMDMTAPHESKLQANIVKVKDSQVNSSQPGNKINNTLQNEQNGCILNSSALQNKLKNLFKANVNPFGAEFTVSLVQMARCVLSPDFGDAEQGKKDAKSSLKGMTPLDFLCSYLEWHYNNCRANTNIKNFTAYFRSVSLSSQNFINFVSYLDSINPSTKKTVSQNNGTQSAKSYLVVCKVCGTIHQMHKECPECGTSYFASRDEVALNKKIYIMPPQLQKAYKDEYLELCSKYKDSSFIDFCNAKQKLLQKFELI